MGQGHTGEEYVREDHLYARDLDLFGEGSLFELLCTTPTAFGHRELAEWLNTPASRETALERQKAVQELCGELELRAGLSAAGDSYALEADTGALRSWLMQPDQRISIVSRIALVVLTLSLVAAVILTHAGILAAPLSYLLLGVMGAAQLAAGLWMRRRVTKLLSAVSLPSTTFEGLTRVFAYLAVSRPFATRMLARACAELSGAPTASASLRHLNRLVRALEARNHDLFEYPSYVLLWGTHWSLAIEAWRLEHREDFLRWLDALATFEAVCSLATFAYERSESCYPELMENENVLQAVGLGHPLLPQEAVVGNDITLTDSMQLAVISGSHMSGKSTFLKAIGVGTVLAWAGAPVPARRFRVSRLALAASTKVGGSLHDRKSRFLAEAERIGKILELARTQRGVLFLLDEILSGTDSHDRRLGADAILMVLVDAGAIGAITTHDLAITEIVDRLGERARNVHFADSIDEGRLEFDYRLRRGVVETSNALEVLRSCGIRL